MAITSLDQVLAGAQVARYLMKTASAAGQVVGRPFSWWGIGGAPAAGTWSTAINGAIRTGNSVAGQIPRSNPSSGNAYLARLTITPGAAGAFVLADRIWDNQLAVNDTTSQSITTPTWPARDVNGSTNGDGILIGIETSAAASATAVAATLTYTNEAGTGSRTASLIDASAASATIAGAFFRFGLQGGDKGVRSIQSIQFSTAWTTGTINAVAYRPIAQVEANLANLTAVIDAMTGGLPRIYDNSVPYLFCVPNAAAAFTVNATYTETQG